MSESRKRRWVAFNSIAFVASARRAVRNDIALLDQDGWGSDRLAEAFVGNALTETESEEGTVVRSGDEVEGTDTDYEFHWGSSVMAR